MFLKQPETFYPNLIFQPYGVNAWFAFLVSVGFISICVYTVAYFSGETSRICECIILKVFGLFAQQGEWIKHLYIYKIRSVEVVSPFFQVGRTKWMRFLLN